MGAEHRAARVTGPLIMIVLSTVGWPLLEVTVFWLRFGRAPLDGPLSSLVFAPMGLAAGVVAAVLMYRSAGPRQRRAVVWGYLSASPVAFLGSLLGGLLASGAWGPLLAGGVPLAIGCVVGFVVGRPRTAKTGEAGLCEENVRMGRL
jgi:hypothetical protein